MADVKKEELHQIGDHDINFIPITESHLLPWIKIDQWLAGWLQYNTQKELAECGVCQFMHTTTSPYCIIQTE